NWRLKGSGVSSQCQTAVTCRSSRQRLGSRLRHHARNPVQVCMGGESMPARREVSCPGKRHEPTFVLGKHPLRKSVARSTTEAIVSLTHTSFRGIEGSYRRRTEQPSASAMI